MMPGFLRKLDNAREIAGVPFSISSGYRCESHNQAVGSTSTNHLRGLAADIRCVSGQDRLEVLRGLLSAGFRRIGVYRTFVHVDTNEGPEALWLG
jgi:zinc D-Ala-D-Ala carboxypeptidase